MNIVSLEVQGFQGFRDYTELDLSTVRLAAVVGANRAGKSSIMVDAVLFALYGRSRSTSIKDVTTRGQKNTTVRLVFTHGGQTYRITRIRGSRNEVVLERQVDGEFVPLSRDKHGDADEMIRELIGMDYTMSTLTWAIVQGKSDLLSIDDPAPRRRKLASAFGLDDYTTWHKNAKDATKNEAANLIRLKESRERLLDEMNRLAPQAQADLEALETELSQVRQSIQQASSYHGISPAQARSEYESLQAQSTTAQQTYQRTYAQAQETLAQWQSLMNQVEGRVDVLEERISHGEELERSTLERMTQRRTDLGVAQSQREATRTQIHALENLAGAACPTCTQVVPPQVASGIIARLYRDVACHDQAVGQAETDLREGQEALASTRERLSQLRQFVSDRERLRPQIEHAELVVSDPSLAPVADTERLEALQKIAKGSAPDQSALQAHLEDLVARRAQVVAARTRSNDLQTELSNLQAQQEASQQRHDGLLALSEAFHEGGIPTMILSGIVAEINSRAQTLLRDMGGDDLGVAMSLDTGKLYIQAIQGNFQVDYSTLSGSEKFRIDLALRLAILQAKTARSASAGISTIMWDEAGWGALDAPMKESIVGVLFALSRNFDLYVISHDDAVNNALPAQIQVWHSDGSSHAQVAVR